MEDDVAAPKPVQKEKKNKKTPHVSCAVLYFHWFPWSHTEPCHGVGKKKVEPSSTQLTAENNNNAMFITAAAAAAAAGYTGNNKKRLLKNQPDNNKAI